MTMAAGGHPSSPLLGHDGAALRRYEGPVQRLRAHGLMLLWALGLIAAVLACLPPAAQVRGTAEAAQRRVAPDAAPLMLTALLEEGRTAEARAASRVVVHGVALGHSGYFSVPSASGRNTNHLFTWYQPCEGCDPRTAPLIQWFNGGPGSPDTAGRRPAHAPRASRPCSPGGCLSMEGPGGRAPETGGAGRGWREAGGCTGWGDGQ